MNMISTESSFLEQCKKYLEKRWSYVRRRMEDSFTTAPPDLRKPDLKALIQDCLTSRTKSYHYVLPTQLLSKCVNHSLDSHSIQAAYGKRGAFDAQTIAHGVIVPFDKSNHNVLGGSSEPYVNNPLRCAAVTKEFRAQQKNKTDWDKLIKILDYVENQNDKNETAALFRTAAQQFELFDDVRRQKVNVADASSGMGADIECRLEGEVVLLVEVKDRALTLTQLNAKLDIARARKISEILFLAEQGFDEKDKEQSEKRVRDEFASGQNI